MRISKLPTLFLALLACSTAAAQAFDYDDIADGRFRPVQLAGIRPTADGEHYTTIRDGNIFRHRYAVDDAGTALLPAAAEEGAVALDSLDRATGTWCDAGSRRLDIADYAIAPDGGVLVADGAEPIKLISYNLRNSHGKDGDNVWMKRRHATPEMIRREAPDVFGVQEGLIDQLHYIDTECPQYARVGVGRDDGKEGGEIMAVFYLRDRYDLLDHGDLWLSETPDRVSRGWDGACNRTMTWVHLREKATGKEFYYFNTHLDHKGVVARREGVKLVVREVQQIAGRKAAVVVGGDLNSTIDDRIFDPLKKFMTPAREKAPVTDRKGTYNGWGQAPNSMVIDHLFVRNMKCLSYRTLDGDYGVPYISDHYPIEIVVRLK